MTHSHGAANLGLEVAQGGEHYHDFVGIPAEFEWMGAYQFQFLLQLGLRESHTLLGNGCGVVGCYFPPSRPLLRP